MKGRIFLPVLLIVLGVLAWAFWPQLSSLAPQNPQNEEVVACTMDAMQCPDGRWIGRSGPNCEFVC